MNAKLFDSSIFETDQQAVEFISNVLESSTAYSIVATDLNLVVMLWNEGARRLYGYEPDEVIGKLDILLVHTLDDIESGKIRGMFESAVQDGKWEGSVQVRSKSDEQFIVRMVIVPRFDSRKRAVGFLLISKDISSEIRLTAQLECANGELREQILQRQKAESALLAAHQELKHRAQELEYNASQMRLLAVMGELLQSCVTSDEARQVAVQTLEKFFPTHSGVIYLNNESGTSVELFAKWNCPDGFFRETFEPEECWALRLGRQHAARGETLEIRCIHAQDAKRRGSICIPMMAQGQSLGLFHVVWAEGAAQDTSRAETQERIAITLADTLSLAISNVRLRERLKEQTIRDPLTRLYNRRYMEDSLNREICRARRTNSTVGIIILDIDDFKEFNDSFGHPQGDQVLRSLGEYLRTNSRPGDIPSRYGGEEFTLILPGASSAIIYERAESLRKGFRRVHSHFEESVGMVSRTISFSCGVAVFPDHGADVTEVLQAADEALYEAKRNGKDRVVASSADAKMVRRLNIHAI